jgi:hypothetical protein
MDKILKDLSELQSKLHLCKDLDKESVERLRASLNEALEFIKKEALHETCNNRFGVVDKVPTEACARVCKHRRNA